MQATRATFRLVGVLGVFVLAATASCGSTERRPNVPPSSMVKDLRQSAGSGVQDCGEASESKTDVTCRVQPVGECIESALKACRPAFGVRSFFSGEGDPIRDDWLVLSDGQGGCQLVLVEDRSADPLASRKPSLQVCSGMEWKPQGSVANCEAPALTGCHSGKAHEL